MTRRSSSSAARTVRSPSQSTTSPSRGRKTTPEGGGDEVEQGDGADRDIVDLDEHPDAEGEEDLLADPEERRDGVEDRVPAFEDEPPRRWRRSTRP